LRTQVEAFHVSGSLRGCTLSFLLQGKGAAMSLSAWEQQALDSIRDGLADSEPKLAALLATFTRLESGEEMPAREEIQAGSRQAAHRPRRKGRHRARRHVRRVYRHLGYQRAALLVWLLITVVLSAVAVVLNAGAGHGTCMGSWSAICSHSAPAGHPAHFGAP
jgi:hypothetical protein